MVFGIVFYVMCYVGIHDADPHATILKVSGFGA